MTTTTSRETVGTGKAGAVRRWFAEFDNATILALLVGFLPVVGGLLFRTHSYRVSPGCYEALRQFDFPDIIFEILVILWAIKVNFRMRNIIRQLDLKARLAMSIFFATFSIGAIFSAPAPDYALMRALYWVVHVIFGFAVYHLLKNTGRREIVGFCWIVVGGLCAYLPLVVIHFSMAPDPSATKPIVWSSAMPGYRSIREFGFLAGYVLALWIGFTHFSKVLSRTTIIRWAITIVLLTILFWSGTRAAIVGVAIASLIMCAVCHRTPSISQIVMTIFAITAATFISTQILPPDPSFGLFRSAENYVDVNQVSSGRIDIWIETLHFIVQRPFFGWGEGSLYWLSADARAGYHLQPHNFILQFAMSFGLVATAAAFYLLGRLLLNLHRALSTHMIILAPLLMLDCLLVMALFDGVLFFSRSIMAAAVAIGICCAVVYRDKWMSVPKAADQISK